MDNAEQIIVPREKTYLSVVIHVLYRVDIENITDEQVLSQIDVLNEDFSKTNSNFSDTPDIFAAVAADTEIQFCLATIDPDGNATSGITRTQTNVDDIGLTDAYFQTNEGGIDAWDNNKYINIWVADMGTSSVSGTGTFPGQAIPPEKDGILVNFKFFGREGIAKDFFPHNLGRICTHEMGHFFGVPHIFGSIGTACDVDDGFMDTPLQDAPSFACPDFPAPDLCTQNNGVMFMNFMDYTDDECMSMFTEEQKNRMWETLNGPRSDLKSVNQDMCIVDTSTPEVSAEWNLNPNPAKSLVFISDEKFMHSIATVYDITGKICASQRIRTNKASIDISTLQSGIYFVKYKQSVKKLVVQ